MGVKTKFLLRLASGRIIIKIRAFTGKVNALMQRAFFIVIGGSVNTPATVWGDIIAEIKGKTRTILKGERTALNLIQHMSGVATATKTAVDIVRGTNASIADTRKTLPGLRPLQKYAVTVGGGRNHRYNLSDAAMLKDNHVDASGGIAPAVAKLKSKLGHMTKIELEVRNLDELGQALEAGVDVIMLDNMSIEEMREAVEITNGRALLEASGNITSETLRAIAKTGVDIISMGALTHSVKAFDISLKISD